MKFQQLLVDFVFGDCRLASHPRVFGATASMMSGDSLNLVARVSKQPPPFGSRRVDMKPGVSGNAWEKREAYLGTAGRDTMSDFLKANSVESYANVPILGTERPIGVLSLYATEKSFVDERGLSRLQLLAAMIGVAQTRSRKGMGATPPLCNWAKRSPAFERSWV